MIIRPDTIETTDAQKAIVGATLCGRPIRSNKMHKKEEPKAYGIVAEFSDPEEIVVAAHKAREAGYRKMDAYTPFPIHGLSEAIGFKDNRVPWLIFFGGLFGCAFGFWLQSYLNVVEYPMNVGGRPLIPWPSFIPVTFECTVLSAAFFAVFGAVLGLNGLPKPHHPIFNTPNFSMASQERFFLCIEASDAQYNAEDTRSFLQGLGPSNVAEVEN
jgi:hypothetical protein